MGVCSRGVDLIAVRARNKLVHGQIFANCQRGRQAWCGWAPQATFADPCLISKTQVTSASLLTLPLNFRPGAVTTFRIVAKLGRRSPDKTM